MPGLTITAPTLVKAGCLEADTLNILNTALGGVNTALASTPGVVANVNNGAVPFGNYTTAGTSVSLLASTGPAGTYRVSVYAVITTTFTGATAVQHVLGYTDDQGARTVTFALGALTAGTFLTSTDTFRSNGTAAITILEQGTVSNATAGAMALSVVLERLL